MGMNLYQWLCLFSVPALFLTFLKMVHSQFKKQNAENLAMRKGLQALLRAQLVSEWNRWSERKYAPIYARQNFENCWIQYHALGANGVMDDIHARFFELPTEPPTHEKAGD